MLPLSLVDGELSDQISVLDRGLAYGDGVFTTLPVLNTNPQHLQRHLLRLASDCARLQIPWPGETVFQCDIDKLRVCADFPDRAVIKLMVTRGIGGRGYRLPEPVYSRRISYLYPYPVYPEQWYSSGIQLRFCSTRLGHNPQLAGIKHLNRLEQVLARAEWQDDRIQEGLVLDQADRVIEGTMSNLFLVRGDEVITPLISHCGVAGVQRARIIDRVQQRHDLRLLERHLCVADVLAADELFMTNSIIGIWPVAGLADKNWAAPGPVTRLLMQSLDDGRV